MEGSRILVEVDSLRQVKGHECRRQESRVAKDSADDVSLGSVHQNHGYYHGEDEPWRGCVCDKIHPRPAAVFWIRCDGPCRTWFCVAESCVGFDANHAASLTMWTCPHCSKSLSLELLMFLSLPVDLFYKILTFCSAPYGRAAVLCQQIVPLCRATHHAVEHHESPWSSLWSLILERDYAASASMSCHRSKRQKCGQRQISARRETKTTKDRVRQEHSILCGNTDDAHMALATMAESKDKPLSLARLRQILKKHDPILINRRSPTGRTFLMTCCAADFVDERVVHSCVQELVVAHGADPNVWSTCEAPNANRTVLFFAISRVMPSVVEYLIVHAGARVQGIVVKGRHQFVSAKSMSTSSFRGSFTPLSFAERLQQGDLPSCYWVSKLIQCIRILRETPVAKEEDAQSDLRRRYQTRSSSQP